jgi:hypothetical protein
MSMPTFTKTERVTTTTQTAVATVRAYFVHLPTIIALVATLPLSTFRGVVFSTLRESFGMIALAHTCII